MPPLVVLLYQKAKTHSLLADRLDSNVRDMSSRRIKIHVSGGEGTNGAQVAIAEVLCDPSEPPASHFDICCG